MHVFAEQISICNSIITNKANGSSMFNDMWFSFPFNMMEWNFSRVFSSSKIKLPGVFVHNGCLCVPHIATCITFGMILGFCDLIFLFFWIIFQILQKVATFYNNKVRVATITHDHDVTHQAILTLLVVPAGKWLNL